MYISVTKRKEPSFSDDLIVVLLVLNLRPDAIILLVDSLNYRTEVLEILCDEIKLVLCVDCSLFEKVEVFGIVQAHILL